MPYRVQDFVLHFTNIHYKLKINVISNITCHYIQILPVIIFKYYPCYFTFETKLIFKSQYMLKTCKRDLVLYKALLIVCNNFRAHPEDGSIKRVETYCYKLLNYI